MPTYDISTCAPRGARPLTADHADVVLAEGIFAAEIVPHLQSRGLLAGAYCIRQNRWLTFWRRFVRDLAERRKPPLVLWQRGLRLCRAEPGIVRHHASLGARPGPRVRPSASRGSWSGVPDGAPSPGRR